jgi:RimJ/RimL family protein N-acetyltransferase
MAGPEARGAKVLETGRLTLRRLAMVDAPFILALLNDPAWLEFIGDRGVRTVEDARTYILKGPIEMYAKHGFGLYLTELKSDGTPIGLCGLIRRKGLEDVDIGFAFLPAFRAQGYALESASAVMAHARSALGLKRIVGITLPGNRASIKLLEKIGLKFERMVKLPDDGKENMLFASEATGELPNEADGTA